MGRDGDASTKIEPIVNELIRLINGLTAELTAFVAPAPVQLT